MTVPRGTRSGEGTLGFQSGTVAKSVAGGCVDRERE